MAIALPPETTKQVLASIKRYVAEHLEQEIGDLQAGLLLDYVLKEIGPTVYNQAILYANGERRSMDAPTLNRVLGMALRGVDTYAWVYWEGANWYNPIGGAYGIPTEWYNAINQAWLATRVPTEAPAPAPPPPPPTGTPGPPRNLRVVPPL